MAACVYPESKKPRGNEIVENGKRAKEGNLVETEVTFHTQDDIYYAGILIVTEKSDLISVFLPNPKGFDLSQKNNPAFRTDQNCFDSIFFLSCAISSPSATHSLPSIQSFASCLSR